MTVTLRSNLDAIASALPRKVDKELERSADDVARLAKALVPYVTGNLQRGIHTERREFAEHAVVAGHRKGKNAPFYGHLVEGGTLRGGVPGGRGERGPTPPRPFLVPALETYRPIIRYRVIEALNDVGNTRG